MDFQERNVSPVEFNRKVDTYVTEEIQKLEASTNYHNLKSISDKLQYINKFRQDNDKRKSDIPRNIGKYVFFASVLFCGEFNSIKVFTTLFVSKLIIILVFQGLSLLLGRLNDSWLNKVVSTKKIMKMRNKNTTTATMYLPDFGKKYCTLWFPLFFSIINLLSFTSLAEKLYSGGGLFSAIGSLTLLFCYVIAKNMDIPYAHAYLNDDVLLEGEYKKQDKQRVTVESTIENIRTQGEQEKAKYREEFEQNVIKASVQFAGSDGVQLFTERIRPVISKAVTEADRRPHIEIIKAPVTLSVYSNQITFDDTKFDFDEERMANMSDFIQVGGLARAIASALQIDIIEQFPEDVCGTVPSVKLQFDYKTEDCVDVTVIYEAPNSNYQPTEEWNDNAKD
jgi:hypothetical protein